MWLSWLERRVVAPKAVGSIPIIRPICRCRIMANMSAFQANDASSILATCTKVKTRLYVEFLLWFVGIRIEREEFAFCHNL